jgi:hypothetical protein
MVYRPISVNWFSVHRTLFQPPAALPSSSFMRRPSRSFVVERTSVISLHLRVIALMSFFYVDQKMYYFASMRMSGNTFAFYWQAATLQKLEGLRCNDGLSIPIRWHFWPVLTILTSSLMWSELQCEVSRDYSVRPSQIDSKSS